MQRLSPTPLQRRAYRAQYKPRLSRGSIVGLFWHQSRARQDVRIRELHRSGLSVELIATLCRRPVAMVHQLVEAQP
jgi:hypothetical protein